jgi:hypothetical protein
MPRLTSPTGITVNVSDEKAEQLSSVGYRPVGESKAPAKKAASRKPSAKTDDE